MGKKFNTAEEFLKLPEEVRIKIAKQIVEQGDDALDWIEVEEERALYKKLQEHYTRIEKLAYAIGDQILELETEGNENDVSYALHEFMWSAAQECDLQYSGEYYSHEDGFWEPSTF